MTVSEDNWRDENNTSQIQTLPRAVCFADQCSVDIATTQQSVPERAVGTHSWRHTGLLGPSDRQQHLGRDPLHARLNKRR